MKAISAASVLLSDIVLITINTYKYGWDTKLHLETQTWGYRNTWSGASFNMDTPNPRG